MKAALVGTVGDRKLYYILDSPGDDNDGALVTSDGRVMELNFFSFVNKTSGIKKIMRTPFHEYLWAPPSEKNQKDWFDTFVNKKKQVDEKMLAGMPVLSSVGGKKEKLNK